MSLLSHEEREKLKQEGLYVKEKCDSCGKPILTPMKAVKDGKDLCTGLGSCYEQMKASGQWKVGIPRKQKSNQEEAGSMATTKKESSGSGGAEKVGGHYRKGSTLANFYEVLSDEKKHSVKQILKTAGKDAKNPMFLLKALKKDGEKKFKEWGIAINDDEVQMKMGKSAAAAAAKAPAKPSPSTPSAGQKNAPKQPPATAKTGSKQAPQPVSKSLAAVVSLLRKTLKSAGTWTKNKLVEELKTKAGIDQKETLTALSREINLGGIIQKKGVFSLA